MSLYVCVQVQALYHIPSLGQQVDLNIIHMEIQKTEMFENHGGEREPLLGMHAAELSPRKGLELSIVLKGTALRDC